jgi:uncharacterized membrane protein YedE/YeeE
MKLTVSAFICGLVFSLGLTIGGMTIPNNIIGFLDITGAWKPALMFVMVGAIFIYSIGFRLIMRRRRPLFDFEFHVPQPGVVTARLIIGAALFGVGWGLGGFCPGPAFVSAGAGSLDAIVFTAFIFVGMWIHRVGFDGV